MPWWSIFTTWGFWVGYIVGFSLATAIACPVSPHLASGTLFILSSSLRRRASAPTIGVSLLTAHGAGTSPPTFTGFPSGERFKRLLRFRNLNFCFRNFKT